MLTKEERIIIKNHCLKYDLNYKNIIERIKYRLAKKDEKEEKSLEELLDFVTERYKNKQTTAKIKDNFRKLKAATTNKEYREICNNLKINWKHVLNLSYSGYDKKETILYFWYFYDEIKDGKKDISRKRLLELNEETKLINQDIYYLLSLYKCGKTNYLEQILNQEEIYLKKTTTIIANRFKLTSTEKEDLLSEARLIFIEILEKITLNNIRQIISYIRIVLFGNLVAYVKKNYQRIPQFNEKYMYKKEELDECNMI